MDTQRYPKAYRRNIRKLCDRLCVDVETAYRMMLTTATLMDLRPEDDEVLHMILQDCVIDGGDVA